ncbi:MAG: hypothetical protein A3C27_01270 [Candidatus Levybacteria bacterium RIFCSPHIGHO2_02_FULL_39_36]|nr:MAG: hypothetical protein UT20_C0048G0005 [Candidatus Levybacteria bacterium GW2011_GWA1_39_11]OGH15313.1 MAG: hypothetical protein A2689_02835 [Candidatus Levybacteria bacterium RIFCSPHIGHO2_01_FULL_38_96]OGH26514.1 MAG: hypothetical protein A3E68_02810 [Candidatus Levybacteria bacterium RIFCSPHIGHO2_12_FULL_39_39]OGH27473.1 MAG: hypothetical protein A3C27_01270 [Candidatus Levybacteria bacterium RIFCSPHIGHO2_02_FULL_39_36]OGH36219.1 MAG: hypothetical protein A3B43_00515 [Candidatus Levybac
MELFQFLIQLFSNQDLLFRIILIILISFYILFALILAMQIRNLNRIVNQITFSPIFKLLSFIHLGAAIALLIFTVLFL